MILCFRGDNNSHEKKIVEKQINPELDSDTYVAVLAECDEIGVQSTLLRPEWIIPSIIDDASLNWRLIKEHPE